MTTNLEIIIGTYEEFLLGYKLDTKDDKELLTQSFADKSHSGALKCLAVQGHWIATGATDDRIFIYDMKSRKQSQILLTHEGTINALAFTPDGTHLLSGGADGRMIAVRLNTWFTEATWTKAHGGSAVTHISCHPSGKLALSLGSDLVLRTWNLVKGRVAYKTNLKSKSATLGSMPDCLTWSPSGNYFTLTGQRVFEIWSIKTADVMKTQKTASKPVCVQWVNETDCLVGLEDGKILWIAATAEDENIIEIEAHDARVKAMALQGNVLVTASSSGEVKTWRVNENKKKLKQIAATNIGCRPTCIGILELDQFGPDYLVTKTIEQKQEVTHRIDKAKIKPQERGVVTIEYDNDDDIDNEENDADSDVEKEDGKDIKSDEGESLEASDKQNNESSNDDDGDDDDDDDSEDAEPQIRLPKSRKRKQQILSKQKLAKNLQLSDNSKESKHKKQKTTQKNMRSSNAQKKQKMTK